MTPRPDPNYPGWVWIDCGCCAGIEWGGEYPRECRWCRGGGQTAIHVKSQRIALWPGGPFHGRADPRDLERWGVLA